MNYPCKAFSVSLSSPALTVSQYTSSDWSLADTEYDRVRRALDEDFLPETLLKHGMLCMTCILTERVIRGPNGFLIFCCILLPYCYHPIGTSSRKTLSACWCQGAGLVCNPSIYSPELDASFQASWGYPFPFTHPMERC